MSQESCRSCHYWKRMEGEDGACRRYPPRVIDASGLTFFPHLKQNDWCGEYKASRQKYRPSEDEDCG